MVPIDLVITVLEPGGSVAMDEVTLKVNVVDSRLFEVDEPTRMEWTDMSWWVDDERGQVALGQVLLIVLLLGLLVRSSATNAVGRGTRGPRHGAGGTSTNGTTDVLDTAPTAGHPEPAAATAKPLNLRRARRLKGERHARCG